MLKSILLLLLNISAQRPGPKHWIRMTKEILLLILSLIPMHSNAADRGVCYAVTGFRNDEATFSEYLDHSTNDSITFQNFKCKRFQSWADLIDYHRSHPVFFGKVLIIQISHGHPGGEALVEKGDVPGTEIFNVLREISQTTRVGFLNESCYSGDLIARKILFDRAHPKDQSVKNLCMVSNSSFNQMALGGPEGLFSAINRKYNFEKGDLLEVFSEANHGLISAVPFDYNLDLRQLANAYHVNSNEIDFNKNKMQIRFGSERIFSSDVCRNIYYSADMIFQSKIEMMDKFDFNDEAIRRRGWRLKEAVSDAMDLLKLRGASACPDHAFLQKLIHEITHSENLSFKTVLEGALMPRKIGDFWPAGVNRFMKNWSNTLLAWRETMIVSETDEARYQACANF